MVIAGVGTGPVDVCTVEDVAREDGVTAADVRGAAAETLDAVSGVVAVAGSGADVDRSGLGRLMGTSNQAVGCEETVWLRWEAS